MDRFSGSNDEHVNNPCVLCNGPSEGCYCQICKQDICHDCLIDHSHGMDK